MRLRPSTHRGGTRRTSPPQEERTWFVGPARGPEHGAAGGRAPPRPARTARRPLRVPWGGGRRPRALPAAWASAGAGAAAATRLPAQCGTTSCPGARCPPCAPWAPARCPLPGRSRAAWDPALGSSFLSVSSLSGSVCLSLSSLGTSLSRSLFLSMSLLSACLSLSLVFSDCVTLSLSLPICLSWSLSLYISVLEGQPPPPHGPISPRQCPSHLSGRPAGPRAPKAPPACPCPQASELLSPSLGALMVKP